MVKHTMLLEIKTINNEYKKYKKLLEVEICLEKGKTGVNLYVEKA